MILTPTQRKAVNNLFEVYKNTQHKAIDFKAPTGSGKTFMAAHFISRVFAANNYDKTMIVIATVSTAELPKAFAKKINNYKKYLPFKNFTVEHRESPSTAKKVVSKIEHVRGFDLVNNKVLIFGTQSFGTKKLFTEQGILDKFILDAEKMNWKIIYIRDEAHRGGVSKKETGENNYSDRFEERLFDLASFNIQMTATPKGNFKLISVEDKDLKNDEKKLLKNSEEINKFTKDTSTSMELTEEIIKKFKKIQKDYDSLGLNIRPALLIQVSIKKKDFSAKHDEMIRKLLNFLEKKKLKYLKYFSNDVEGNAIEEKTLDSASRNNSMYDAIVFKTGPATGWDIPRACMLLQLREIHSETLNIQTIGRIRRNPYPNLEYNEITDKYYIYSNYRENKHKSASYTLKKKFQNKVTLYQGIIELSAVTWRLFEKKYSEKVIKFLKESAFADFIKENYKKNKLITNITRYHNKHGTKNIIEEYVKNIFELKTWLLEKLEEFKKYFTKGIKNFISEQSNKYQIPAEIIKYTIIYSYISTLKEHYWDSYKMIRKNEEYKLKRINAIINNYKTWILEQNTFINTSKFDNYGYSLIESINKNPKERTGDGQFLDSFPEYKFMEKVFEEFKEEESYTKKVSFFSKMPTYPSQIYFEYIKSKDIDKHKAYIDFALVAGNKVLMIEVKGWNDYDPEKTKDLLYAFKKYTEAAKKINLKLKVCYAGKKEGKREEVEVKYLVNENGKDVIKGESIRAMFRKLLKNND